MNRSLITKYNLLRFLSVLVFLCSLIGIFYIKSLTGNYDDLSVIRASAYLNAHPNDPLVAKLNNHLEKYQTQLGSRVYGRYLGRLNNTSAYYLQNQLIPLIEKFWIESPYGSVTLVGMFQHCLAVLILVLVLFAVPGLDVRYLVLSLMLAALPTALFPAVMKFLQFSPFHMQYVWYTPAARGASLTAILAVFILLEFGKNTPRKYFIPLLFLAGLLSLIIHLGTFILFFIQLSVIFVVRKTGIYRIEVLLQKFKPLWLLGLYNFLFVLIAFAFRGFFTLVFHADFQAWTLWNNPIYWTVAANLVILLWCLFEQFKTPLINILLSYFIPIGLIASGFTLFQTSSYDLRWSNLNSFYLFEGAERLTGFVQALFWMIAIAMIMISLRKQNRLPKMVFTIAAVVVVLAGNIFWTYPAWQKERCFIIPIC